MDGHLPFSRTGCRKSVFEEWFMMFGYRSCRRCMAALAVLALVSCGSAFAADYSSMGISVVVGTADAMLRMGNYEDAIPALREIIERTRSMDGPDMRETLQHARFQLGRAYFQIGDSA